MSLQGTTHPAGQENPLRLGGPALAAGLRIQPWNSLPPSSLLSADSSMHGCAGRGCKGRRASATPATVAAPSPAARRACFADKRIGSSHFGLTIRLHPSQTQERKLSHAETGADRSLTPTHTRARARAHARTRTRTRTHTISCLGVGHFLRVDRGSIT